MRGSQVCEVADVYEVFEVCEVFELDNMWPSLARSSLLATSVAIAWSP